MKSSISQSKPSVKASTDGSAETPKWDQFRKTNRSSLVTSRVRLKRRKDKKNYRNKKK